MAVGEAAVVGHHFPEGAENVQLGAPGLAELLGVGAMQVAHETFGVKQFTELAE